MMEVSGTDTIRDSMPVRCAGGGTIEVAYDSSATVAELITAAVTAADLPRADFQGSPLPWHLADSTGQPVDPAATLLTAGIHPSSTVEVTGPGVADIITKRDEWLLDAQAQADGTAAPGSVHANTLLALVRRTGSSLSAVESLSAKLSSAVPTNAITEAAPRPSPVPRIAASVVLVALVGVAWAWVFTDWFGASGDGDASDGLEFNVPLEVSEAIDANGEEDLYDFGAREGQRIRIQMIALQGQGLDPELILYDAEGGQIARNDDNGRDGTLNSLIDIEIPADGTYSAVARGLGGSGSGGYELTIEDGDALDDFEALDLGQFVEGEFVDVPFRGVAEMTEAEAEPASEIPAIDVVVPTTISE